MKIPFPSLIRDLVNYYPSPIVKEKTDEDWINELKAIAMFKPELFEKFLKEDYDRILNRK